MVLRVTRKLIEEMKELVEMKRGERRKKEEESLLLIRLWPSG